MRNLEKFLALVMILRAAGYDQNHEFEGGQWIVNVASLSTQLHVVDDVKATVYGDTLHGPARRDVVASLLFRAIRPGDNEVNIVDWTPALGYQTTNLTTSGGAFDGNGATGTLGEVWFGMKEVTGIVVGNQDTGETKTRINTSKDATNHPEYAYMHQEKNKTAYSSSAYTTTDTSTSVTIDAKTGLELFGHKVHVWYGTSDKTFWMEDKVVLSKLVYAADDTDGIDGTRLSRTNAADDGIANLGKAAQAAGFNVNLVSDLAVWNQSFGISTPSDYGNSSSSTTFNPAGNNTGANASKTKGEASTGVGAYDGTNEAADYPLYLLISNDSDKKVNMIVALNTVVSRITKTDNVGGYPNVTVPDEVTATPDTTFIDEETGAVHNNRIEVAALTGESVKTLGTPVVGVNVTGTNVTNKATAPDDASATNAGVMGVVNGFQPNINSPVNTGATRNSWYNLRTPSKTVEGTVQAYKYNGDNPTNKNHGGSITLTTANGTETYERSLLADAIVQEPGVDLSAEARLYANYRLYLDAEGKYIWAEPIFPEGFIYGTYADYSTPYGSSSFEYKMIGSNLFGETMDRVIKTVDGAAIGVSNYATANAATGRLNVPARDTANLTIAGITPGAYTAFAINENGALTSAAGTSGPNGAAGFNLSTPVYKADKILGDNATQTDAEGDEPMTITRTDSHLGVVKTNSMNGNDRETYFTENTKFVVVSGNGTDTLKTEVYNGITEFLDGASQVTIRTGDVTANRNNLAVFNDPAYGNTTPSVADRSVFYKDQMYYTRSPYTYASVVGRGDQVDTIILPKSAITWTGKSDLYYLGSNLHTGDLVVGNNHAWRYTMYVDGEPQTVWLDSNGGNAPLISDTTNATVHTTMDQWNDTFYTMTSAGYTLPDGTQVYVAHAIDSSIATGMAHYANGYPAVNAVNTPAAPVIWGNIEDGNNVGQSGIRYTAVSYDAQTATLVNETNATLATGWTDTAGVIYRVAGAKVVNLNTADAPSGVKWPGINNLGTLNDAGSIVNNPAGNGPWVSCVVDPADPMTITTIYVCWNQNTPT